MFDAIATWFTAFVDFLLAIPTAIYDGVLDVVVAVLAMVEGAAAGLLSSLDLSLFTEAQGNIPAEMMRVARMVAAGEALAIVMSALMVRFVMGLIPFVRVGR